MHWKFGFPLPDLPDELSDQFLGLNEWPRFGGGGPFAVALPSERDTVRESLCVAQNATRKPPPKLTKLSPKYTGKVIVDRKVWKVWKKFDEI